ncbi:MAG: F0F1 ATP synthase subunit A [Mycobacteriaceae bacterium]
MNRLMLIRLLVTALLVLFFYLAMRSPKIVPRGIQNLGEMALDFVRVQIADEILGKVNGRRFLPVLTTIFFMVLALNSTGIIPLLNISTNALIGVPLVLAVLSYVTFNYAGIKAKGFGGHMKSSLVVPNLPTPLHFIVIPIEFVSTFILRPFTLTVRLLANMLAGHILLVLFFGATSYFLFDAAGGMKIFGLPSLIMGFIFILFEMLVIVLQAYIFTLLAAVYLELAMSAEH